MSRILITENASVKRELVAPVTTINWDPNTNSGTLNYQIFEMLYINGDFIKSTPKQMISVVLDEMVDKVYNVEVKPGVFVDVPGGVIMLAFKKAFEEALAASGAGYNVATPIEEQVTEEVSEEVIPDTQTP